MGRNEHGRKELEDKAEKVRNARASAERPRATAREKADLKLLEQDYLAEQQKARRSKSARTKGTASKKLPSQSDRTEKKLDAALKDSFPGSDPVSSLEPSPVNKRGRNFRPVKDQQAGTPSHRNSGRRK